MEAGVGALRMRAGRPRHVQPADPLPRNRAGAERRADLRRGVHHHHDEPLERDAGDLGSGQLRAGLDGVLEELAAPLVVHDRHQREVRLPERGVADLGDVAGAVERHPLRRVAFPPFSVTGGRHRREQIDEALARRRVHGDGLVHVPARQARELLPAGGGQHVVPGARGVGTRLDPAAVDEIAHQRVRAAERDAQVLRDGSLRAGAAGADFVEDEAGVEVDVRHGHSVPVTHRFGECLGPNGGRYVQEMNKGLWPHPADLSSICGRSPPRPSRNQAGRPHA